MNGNYATFANEPKILKHTKVWMFNFPSKPQIAIFRRVLYFRTKVKSINKFEFSHSQVSLVTNFQTFLASDFWQSWLLSILHQEFWFNQHFNSLTPKMRFSRFPCHLISTEISRPFIGAGISNSQPSRCGDFSFGPSPELHPKKVLVQSRAALCHFP